MFSCKSLLPPVAAIVVSMAASLASAQPVTSPSGGNAAEEATKTPDGTAAEPVVMPEPAKPQPMPTPPNTQRTPLAISLAPLGYLRVQGSIVQDDPNVAFVGRADGFELQNARAGVDIGFGTKAQARLSIDGAVDERERVNDPNGTLRVGLRDAYVDIHGGPVDVRTGQFKPIFDGEEFLSSPELAFVDTAIYSRGIRATEGFQTAGLSPGRSLGVALRRDPGTPDAGIAFGFEVAAQNGAGELASNNDNNWVAVSAAALLRFANGGWMFVAGRVNPRSEGDLPLRQDETDLQGAGALSMPLGPVQLGLGGIAQRTTFSSSGGAAELSYGAHVQLMADVYNTESMNLSAGYRFAIFDSSNLVLSDRTMEHTAGTVIAWPAYHLRLLFNATLPVEQAARSLSNSRLEGVLEVVL